MSRRLSVALAASLLLNLFAAGTIGGGLFVLRHPGPWRTTLVGGPRPIRDAGDELPQPDRAHFRQAMRPVFAGNVELARTARESRQSAAQLFVQPQFDQAAVLAALERAHDADLEFRSRVEAAAVGFAATLPADERALLAQGLEQGGLLRPPAPARPAAQAP